MGRLTALSPVPPMVALEFAGGRPFLRKVLLHAVRKHDAIALFHEGERLALCMMQPDERRPRRVELAIFFAPASARHIRQMIRFAQLTLTGLAHAGLTIVIRVAPGIDTGERMAIATGFRPARIKSAPALWIWKGRR